MIDIEYMSMDTDNVHHSKPLDWQDPYLWIACLTYVCDAVTVAWTLIYFMIQYNEPCSLNGFCLPNTETHVMCALVDSCVAGCYIVYVYMADKITWTNCAVAGALWLHWLSHYDLYQLTKNLSLEEINKYQHWSFTLVLLVVNWTYCLPRLLFLMPEDVAERCTPSSVISSVGILLLMATAWLERFYCQNFMAYFAGHLVYDVLISLVALGKVLYEPSIEAKLIN